MKLHKTLVLAVTETVRNIFSGGVYADKAVEQALKQNVRFGSRDRRFIAENVYGMVRWWRLINEISGMQKAEDYVSLFGTWLVVKGEELPEWEEFKTVDHGLIKQRLTEMNSVRKIRESVPDWLDELACLELGENVWEKEIHELNKEAKVVLRVNTLKTDRNKLRSLLSEQQIETQTDNEYSDALILLKRQNLQSLKEYQNGLFEIQDASSQLIAPFMELSPGMNVIDACAGAGGKSLHIAAMMKDQGVITSMDVEERKLQELERRAKRGGAKIIKTRVVNSQAISQLENSADRLLLDVPCSGLGVIRRNPDAKWKLTKEFIDEIKKTQQYIISDYSKMLKPGGLMIYATCSILPGENEQQVERFLNTHSEFEFVKDRKVMPSEGFDGFYMAKLKRTQ
ncbi:MAG: methyltransferase [Bacteroidetes bacterium]|jgi:16S rRNA (cytosine967-C5)-methyltransferase|nr:methyltransferase [Bacteroidota bacterium]